MDRSAIHATFSLDRFYPVPAPRVFAAWADPAAKARWFTPDPWSEHELDFRAGGREVARGGQGARGDGPVLTFEALYADIVPDERIVYTATMSAAGTLMTVSLTTVEFRPTPDGTRLLLTEQDTFLDGHEQPRWRERGTADQLTALAHELGDGRRG